MSSDTEIASSVDFGVFLERALRYVAEWRHKCVVVKFGGRALEKNELGTLLEDLVLLQKSGLRPVMVHGGGPEVSRLLERLGITSTFVDGLRVTDGDSIQAVEMVLAGSVNKKLVSMIQDRGGRAVGLCGKDAGMLRAVRHPRSEELGFVGEIDTVDTELLDLLLENKYIPVVSSIGIGPDGETLNLNADTVAAGLAVAMKAEKLIVLTDVAGIHQPAGDGQERVALLNLREASELASTGIVSRGMLPKLEACMSAVEQGVPSSHIIAANAPHGVLVELFTETGIGTMIRAT